MTRPVAGGPSPATDGPTPGLDPAPGARTAGAAETDAGTPAPLPFTEISARRLGPIRRFFVRHPVVMDVLVMAVFGLPGVLGALSLSVRGLGAGTGAGDPGPGRTVLVGLGLLLAGTAALFWRRRRPVLTAAAMTALGVVSTAVSGTIDDFAVGVALTFYAVAASRRSAVTWTTFAAAMVALSAGVWLWESPTSLGLGDPSPVLSPDAPFDESLSEVRIAALTALVIMGLLAVAIGTSVRNRRLHVAELVDRANALARDREQRDQLARATERARIAREMHDVVAHGLSVMIALADGAGAALDRSPERSRTALDLLAQTGRSALSDMRRLLGVLHEPDATFEPQPGSTGLDALVERFRAAGLPVRTTGLAEALPQDAGLQLAVYRLVQESLTNVLRHAPGTESVEVTLRHRPDQLEVEVVDHGPAVPVPVSDGAGHGLIGMRERTSVYGGAVEAGPWRQGWRVHAVLPWQEEKR